MLLPEGFKQYFDKLAGWCALQERSVAELQRKMKRAEVPPEWMPAIIEKLLEEGYINEKRFAQAFAGGKFRMKAWGKMKIEAHLRMHQIDPETIATGMLEIDADTYRQKLINLAHKKWVSIHKGEPVERKQKLIRYLLQKGYEAEAVMAVVKEMTKNG